MPILLFLVPAVGPVIITAPVLSGNPVVGNTLTCSTGIWSVVTGVTYAYQWKRADNIGFTVNVTNVGANSPSYLLVSADAGKFIRCTVTATRTGSGTANSNVLGAVSSIPFANLPVFKFEFSPTTNPFATPVWVDVSPYVLDFSFQYGRQFELNRMEAGTGTITFDNTDRRFDPTNPSSPYYPNPLVMRKFRATALYNNVTYSLFTGYIDSWNSVWEGPSWAEVDATIVDAFEVLSRAKITSTQSTLTTTQGSNKDLTFTSLSLGSGNNSISIEYVNNGGSTVITVTQLAIRVAFNVGTTTASQIMTAVNADPQASFLVTASLAPGSTGAGAPGIMSPTNLLGSNFSQQASGRRINDVLDAIGWPASDRAIDAGEVSIAAANFQQADGEVAKAHINDIENSELGYLFMNGAGIIVFHDRTHRQTAPASTASQATFADLAAPGQFEYSSLTSNYEVNNVYNSISVTPFGSSTAQTVLDATSISQYMLREYTLSSLLTTNSDALDLAQGLLLTYKQPSTRFSQLTLEPMNDPALWTQVLTRQIGDRVTVIRRPPVHGAGAGTVFSVDCYIEYIQYDVRGGDRDVMVTYQLSPAGSGANSGSFSFQLNDPVRGLLDNSNTIGF